MIELLKKAPVRFKTALGYSWEGLKAAKTKEDAFKLELLGLAALILIMLPTPWPLWKKLALAASYLLIPLMEVINSALEDLCDLVSPEFNPLIKTAKDKGSAAVLLAIVINCLVLLALIFI